MEDRPDAERGDAQPELDGLLTRLQAGDVVVVPHLDSLGDSLPKVVRHVQQLAAAGIGLRSLAEVLNSPAQPLPTATLAKCGQGSSQEADSRRRGAGGRPSKLSSLQQADVVEKVLSGQRTAAAMAKRYRVNPATISRLLAAQRASAAAPAPGGPVGSEGAAADRIIGILPPSALDERLAIVGTSGSGKTYAAKGLIEGVMAGGGRVCVVDPLGVWWGRGRGADGAAAPFPVAVSHPGRRRSQARTTTTVAPRARVTATSNYWPSAAVWAGRKRLGAAGAIRPKRRCSGINT